MSDAPVPGTGLSNSNFKSATLRGLSWSLGASLTRQALSFIIGVVLARALSPEEFGLLGMVLVFTGFVNLFVGQGWGAVIIQKQNVTERHLDSLFWLNLFLGFVCTCLLALAAPWIAAFYRQPVLQPLTALISTTFFISAFNVVQYSLLSRSIDFRKIAIIDTLGVIIGGAAGVYLALNGHGVWSLAWQSIISVSVVSLLTWFSSAWRPKFRFDIAALQEVMGYTLLLLASNVLGFLGRNFDNLLIGRYLSAHALGIYGKAYQLMLLPLSQVSWVVARVMFPALSAIQHDIEKVKRVYLQAMRSIALVTFPLMVGLFVVSRPFVLFVFGEKWIAMVLPLQILCWVGLIQSIGTSFGWIYNSQGRTDIQFKWGLFSISVILAAFVIGLRWGVVGVATSYLLCMLVMLYPDWAIPGRIIRLRVSEMFRNLAGPFFASCAMGLSVGLLGLVLPADWPAWETLAAQVPMGLGVYWALVHLFKVRAYLEVREILMARAARSNG